jgi:hypothetical protein
VFCVPVGQLEVVIVNALLAASTVTFAVAVLDPAALVAVNV